MFKELINTKSAYFKKRIWFSVIISLFFSVLQVMGYELATLGYTRPGFKGKAIILLFALLLELICFPLTYLLFFFSEKIKSVDYCQLPSKSGKRKVFFISWIIIFVSYIPAFLAYYPMILSYDFHRQSQMAIQGFPYYWRLHPYLSTLEISAFLHLGENLGSYSLGMAFMGIFHMLVTSVTFAFVSETVYLVFKNKWVSILTTAFFSLVPFFPVLTLCTTKDVIFTNLFAVFIALAIRRMYYSFTMQEKIAYNILLVFEGILMCLWRNNAVYAVFAAGILLFIFVNKKKKLLVLSLTLCIFLGTSLSNKGIKALLKEEHGSDAVEMLSVVYQTFGRVEVKQRNQMPEEVEKIIAYYLPEKAWDGYNPSISDALKSSIGAIYRERYAGHFGELFKDWIYVGSKYPNEYIDAFLDLTRGLWYIGDRSFADCLGEENGHGMIHTFYSSKSDVLDEIPHETKWEAAYNFYEILFTYDEVLDIPILSILFKPAFYSWVLLLSLLICIYRKNWNSLYVFIYPTLYMFTIMLGPVVQFRYVYPWIVAMPLILSCLWLNKKETKNEAN